MSRRGEVRWSRTEIRSGQTQRPHGRQDEHVSGQEEPDGGGFDSIGLEDIEGGLVAEGALIARQVSVGLWRRGKRCLQGIAQDSDPEDYDCEEVAAISRVASEKLGEDSIVVFCLCDVFRQFVCPGSV